MKTLIARFAKNESGATAIEYALLAAVMGIGLWASFDAIRNNLVSNLGTTASTITTKFK